MYKVIPGGIVGVFTASVKGDERGASPDYAPLKTEASKITYYDVVIGRIETNYDAAGKWCSLIYTGVDSDEARVIHLSNEEQALDVAREIHDSYVAKAFGLSD